MTIAYTDITKSISSALSPEDFAPLDDLDITGK